MRFGQKPILSYEEFINSREIQTFEPAMRRAYARYVAEWAAMNEVMMPDRLKPKTNIGQLFAEALKYEVAIQGVITAFNSVKALGVGGSSQLPTAKGIEIDGKVFEWQMGTLTRKC